MIQDNLVVAHEAFHFLKRNDHSGGKGLALKIYMNKAYDRVEWGFLEVFLSKLWYNQIWVSRVLTLVSTVSYNSQVNGFKSWKLIPQRGLRQGDLISPYLFILVFDDLSRLIFDAATRRDLNGIKLDNAAPS